MDAGSGAGVAAGVDLRDGPAAREGGRLPRPVEGGDDGRRVGGRPWVLLAVDVDVLGGSLPGDRPVEV
jgi:hypothetical protein